MDLATITDPELVAVTVARALGLPDQPGRPTMDTLLRFVRDLQMLVVLDNCEHLLDACAALVVAVLSGAAKVTLLATSREAIGVAGEVELAGAVAVTGWRSHRVVHRPHATLGPISPSLTAMPRRWTNPRAPGWCAAGDRAGGGAGAGVVAGRNPRQPA